MVLITILDTSMQDTSKRRLTLMADGILRKIDCKHPGVQLVIGADYTVSEFSNDVANGVIRVKGNSLALMVGNDNLTVGKNVNIAKQIEKLIRQVWIIKPNVEVFVSSVMPKPTQETASQALVMKVNEGIANMCRKLNRHVEQLVKYVPLHQHLLEKWKHTDLKSGKMLVSTRIQQPHGKWFILGSDIPNKAGAEMLLEKMQQFITDGSTTRVEGAHENMIQTRAEAKGKSAKRKAPSDESMSAEGGSKSSSVSPQAASATRSQDHRQVIQKSKVARMVDKWEQLSQGPLPDKLDLELGEESVVRVDLGDLPLESDSVSADVDDE